MLPLAHPPSTKIMALAERLVGTVGSVPLHEQIEDLSIEECRELDAIVFNCERCNWWCSTDELNDGPNDEQWCDQCQVKREEDGDV